MDLVQDFHRSPFPKEMLDQTQPLRSARRLSYLTQSKRALASGSSAPGSSARRLRMGTPSR